MSSGKQPESNSLVRNGYSLPTNSGNTATVDSKGRVVLPKALRERLGITPGTEVEVHAEDGRAVVEPEDDPESIIERMEELVEEASSAREETRRLDEHDDPIAQKHRAAVRRGATTKRDE